MNSYEEKKHKSTIMQNEFSMLQKIILAVAIMTVLIIFVYFCNIPDPNMILIAGVVLCSALFGYCGGITSGVIMLLYELFFISTEYDIQKFSVCLFGIVANMMLVCSLKHEGIKTFKDVELLTEQLKEENANLQIILTQDTLTEIQNRIALRRDYLSYNNRELTVMMLDLDNLKVINDTYGHEAGDRALRKTGALIKNTFGTNRCYRYGGDEFLVICPDLSETDFREKLDRMMKSKPSFEINKMSVDIDFSIGYIHGNVKDTDGLRQFFFAADKRMYASKSAKQQKTL